MADRRSSWSGLRRTLSVKSISSRWMRSPTRWSTQRGDQVGESRSIDPLDDLAGVERPLEGPVGQQLDQRFLTALLQQRGEHPADRRSPLRFGDALDDHPVQHVLDVLVAQHLDQNPQHRGRFGRDPLGVRLIGEPLAEPARDLGVAQLGLDDLGDMKFSRTKVPRPSPSWSFLRLMIAVCGIGMPSGCLNSAVTANQSASAPTMPASAAART